MDRFLSLRTALVALIFASFSLTGCENGNLFGRLHDRGDSGNITSLFSDASSALRDKNYSQALDIYNRILADDPDNAQALYGAAAAAMGTSGLNFGQLVANILNQGGTVSGSGMGGFIQAAREGGAGSQAASNNILYGIDTDRLDEIIDLVLCHLQQIVSGSADGSIRPDDIAVMLDYGAVSLVRAVLRPYKAGFFDIVNNNGSYEIEQGVNFSSICGNPANQTMIETLGRDFAAAYALLNRAVVQLNLSGNQIIVQLRDDIDEAALKLLTSSDPDALPSSCLTILDNIGINDSTFRNQTGAFQAPSGC